MDQEELNDKDLEDILKLVSDWGEGTENLSENVDKVLYWNKKLISSYNLLLPRNTTFPY